MQDHAVTAHSCSPVIRHERSTLHSPNRHGLEDSLQVVFDYFHLSFHNLRLAAYHNMDSSSDPVPVQLRLRCASAGSRDNNIGRRAACVHSTTPPSVRTELAKRSHLSDVHRTWTWLRVRRERSRSLVWICQAFAQSSVDVLPVSRPSKLVEKEE